MEIKIIETSKKIDEGIFQTEKSIQFDEEFNEAMGAFVTINNLQKFPKKVLKVITEEIIKAFYE